MDLLEEYSKNLQNHLAKKDQIYMKSFFTSHNSKFLKNDFWVSGGATLEGTFYMCLYGDNIFLIFSLKKPLDKEIGNLH
jgi:hypothetical protein